MGGSASYRFGKKIANAIAMGESEERIAELQKQRDDAIAREKARYLERLAQNTMITSSASKVAPKNPYSGSYSNERLNDALNGENTLTKSELDKKFRRITGKWWNSLTDDEKKAVGSFTSFAYEKINKLASGADVEYNRFTTKEWLTKTVEDMTNALEKSQIPHDIWVKRGVSNTHIARMIGLDKDINYEDMIKEIETAISEEKIFSINNFMSTGASSDGGFVKDIEMKIFIPKGSKGVYANPFSAHGDGNGIDWNGKSGPMYKDRGEYEILLQKGYKLRPVGINRGAGTGGKDQIIMMIVGQETK